MSELLEGFRKLGVSESTLAALAAKGFVAPSPIQELTIPKLLTGDSDLVGQAQTGTGKTAAFGIPIVDSIEEGGRKPQALVLAPTRELSMQIATEINSFRGERRIRIAPFYGGQPIEIQLQRLRDGVDVVIGTPGRIIDLMERGKLDFSELKFAVLDEADEMLDMGFVEDIEKILAQTLPEKRMLMFSATMPPEILKIAENFMQKYEIIRTQMTQMSTELTEQIYYDVRREDKFDALARIIDTVEDLYGLVFCKTRGDVDEVVERLKQRGYRVEALHGEIAQAQRTKVINLFKEKRFRILVATDVAARGIDVNDLTHVINYSMPQNSETYVHRVGRTGRAGKRGVAITFVTPSEQRKIQMIQREIKSSIRREQLPSGDNVIARKKKLFAEKVAETIVAERHKDYTAFAEELLAQSDSPVETLAAVLQLRFRDELLASNYRDFNPQKKDRSFWEKSAPTEEQVRLWVGVGKLDGFGAVKMLDLLWEKAHVRKSHVGKINCLDRFSFVDLGEEEARSVLSAFRTRGPKVHYAREEENFDGNSDFRDRAPRRPRQESFSEEPDFRDRAPRRPRQESSAAAADPSRRMAKTPPAEKRRKVRDWVEKVSADIELKEKRAKRKNPSGRNH